MLLNATGYVVAQRKAAISSKATGRLEWLGVAEGSRVKAGDVIARIDARDVVAQAESARANVNAARAALEQTLAEERDALAQLKRNQDLLAKGFVSAASVDTAKARAERATAGVASARATIAAAEATSRNSQVSVDYTVIRAPFDGVILSKSANVGDLVTPFSNATDSKGAVVSMADMSTLEVEADVAESSLSKVKVGQPAEIVLDALPDARFRGRISRMVPTVDRAKATVMTKVKFDEIDPRILPEMSAKVAFLSQDVTPEQQKPLLAVNTDALAQRDGRTVVFAVRDGKAVAVPVTPGQKIGDLTALTGEVKSGERVVAKPERVARRGRARQAREVSASADRLPVMDTAAVAVPRAPPRWRCRRAGVDPQPVQVLRARRPGDPGAGRHQSRDRGGRLRGADGPVGLRQVHAAQPHRRNRQAVVGRDPRGGEDIAQLSDGELAAWRAAHVGFIFQFYNLMPVLTAFQNVELPLQLTSLSRRDRRERVETALALVGLSDRMEHYPNELSGGQQQRVAIARALITDPTLIVADEPTGDLDRTTAEEVLALLERLNGELGKTIIMVTHDPKAAGHARRLIHLEKGVLVD